MPTSLDVFIKLNRAAMSVNRRAHAALREHGLSDTQFGVLDAIYHRGPMPLSSIAEKILCSQNSLSSVVDTMERTSLVVRQRSETDRRVVRVELTDSGRARYESVWPEHRAHIEAALSHLDEEERAALDGLLRKLGKG